MQHVNCLPLRHGLTDFRPFTAQRQPASSAIFIQAIVLIVIFWNPSSTYRLAQALHIFRQTLSQEHIMKLQFGKNQLVLELSKSPFAWFYGQTERMSLTSLSLLFVQFSLFARHPAV
jgi:hypothetical protein